MLKRSLKLFFIIGIITIFNSGPISAQEAAAPAPGTPQQFTDENKMGFGTIVKIDVMGQQVLVAEYDWEKNEPVEVLYSFARLQIKMFNIKDLAELKPGDEVEFEKSLFAGNKLGIVAISKGPVPMEPINLDFNFNLSEDSATTGNDALQPVEVKEGVDVQPPQVIQNNGDVPVVDGSQAIEPLPVPEETPAEAAPAQTSE